MLRNPDEILLVCSKCHGEYPFQAPPGTYHQCRRCHGTSWILQLVYVDIETSNDDMGAALTALTIGGAMLSGGFALQASFPTKTKATSRINVDGLTPETIAVLTQNPEQARTQVLEYARLRLRQKIRERGGECSKCSALYVREEAKPWTDAGYCSKMCAIESGWTLPVSTNRPGGETANPNTLAVTCPQGHTFGVQPSFRGCFRPCPYCGEKAHVPE